MMPYGDDCGPVGKCLQCYGPINQQGVCDACEDFLCGRTNGVPMGAVTQKPPAHAVYVELDWQTGFAVGVWSDGDGVSYCKKDHRNTLVKYKLA